MDDRMDRIESNPKLLVIDDDNVSRLLTITSLGDLGFCVVEADCGEAAISAFRKQQPDLVLLDALMPGMDGFDTCRHIRALPGGQHLPVLMLTGLDDEGSICRAYQAGATDYFVKSGHWTLLVQRIRYLLRANRTRDELDRSLAKEARAQRIARLGHWEWDIARRSCVVSEECYRLVARPVSHQPMSEDKFFQYLHADDRDWVMAIITRTVKEGSMAEVECRIVGTDNVTRTVHLEFETERGTDGRVAKLHGVIQDITERKRTEDQLRVLANYDSLTGLSNRNLFCEQFTLASARANGDGKSVALLFIDLDRFKQINDTLGHAAGDQLLMEVGKRLNMCIRERGIKSAESDLVARLGGDEFVIMLTGLETASDAEATATRILAALRKPVSLSGQECITSASIGIACFPRDGTDTETLMRHADKAKSAAKSNGKNAIQLFKPALNASGKDRLMLEQALHKALEGNELVMHYQPQIDTRLGKIVGAEALMRWQHDGTVVPPAQFIPIAEEIGLIVAFGEWAINHVVGQNRAWIDVGFDPLPIAVNIPGGHFERSDFVGLVTDILTKQRLSPNYLELEITETMLMRNLASTLPTLDAMKALGIRLSVDDFGTGYSSLSYLRRLPIDTLKIDASFVRELQKGPDNEAIVAAIIAMAKSLNLRVIAEGVETHEQMCMLQTYGCHLMQGYYFSRPISAAEFARFRLEYGDQKMPSKASVRGGGRVISLLRSAVGSSV